MPAGAQKRCSSTLAASIPTSPGTSVRRGPQKIAATTSTVWDSVGGVARAGQPSGAVRQEHNGESGFGSAVLRWGIGLNGHCGLVLSPRRGSRLSATPTIAAHTSYYSLSQPQTVRVLVVCCNLSHLEALGPATAGTAEQGESGEECAGMTRGALWRPPWGPESRLRRYLTLEKSSPAVTWLSACPAASESACMDP
jgi:hypothetical protein